MAIPKARPRRHPLATLSLHLAVVGALAMVTAQAPPPPQPQLLTTATGRTVPTTAVAVAMIAFFVLVINQWRRSSSAGAGAGGRQGSMSIRRRGRRGLDAAALAALPVVPYAEIRKHRPSGAGGLECAVCLTAFADGDELRLLPRCSHAFHPDCIDPWLEGHVTCPLCRANLELEDPAPPPAAAASLSSPETKPRTPEAAVAVRVAAENDEEEERKEEAAELEKLRCARRAARMPRSRSTGHSPVSATTAAAAEMGDHDRFTVRLPAHVREEVLKSRRLRHATSLVISLGDASSCAGSSTLTTCAVGGERCPGARRRRWASFLARTTSWVEGSARKGGVGDEAAGTRKPPCGHVVCAVAPRWPLRCKAKNLA